MRLFVNREEMLEKIIKTANKAEKELTFEIGSKLTFPTKFSYVDDLLGLNHKGKIIIRMSVNPEYIIENVEFGTSRLKDRVEAINKLVDADYEVGILIAPVIFLENWENIYHDLIIYLKENLTEKAKKKVFFEVIFMTYSYVHNAINKEAFVNAIEIFDKEKMTGRGKGKYMYKQDLRKEGETFFKDELDRYFKNNKIWYIV